MSTRARLKQQQVSWRHKFFKGKSSKIVERQNLLPDGFRAGSDKNREHQRQCWHSDEDVAFLLTRTLVKVWTSAFQISHRGTPIVCIVRDDLGKSTICDAELNGITLPIEMPSSVLRYHGLTKGKRFLWWMNDSGDVSVDQIDADLPIAPVLTAEEHMKLDDLHEANDRWLDDHGSLGNFDGDGP